MATARAFNAATWFAENTRGGTEVLPETQAAIADFTAMWSFFESSLCANRASIAAFERALENCNPDQASESALLTLDECLAFWRFRYRAPDGFNTRFAGLHFRPGDPKGLVESVLQGRATDKRSELLALLVIVYRLRNNLFHGLKTLEMLNDQVQNLLTACRCLAAILEIIPSRFVTVNRRGTAR
jgi:hypothetical protein